MRHTKNKTPNIKLILKKGEDLKTEFKERVDSNLDKEMVAFANSSGGKIYIGITDEGKIKGIKIANRLKSQIEDIAKNCDPKIPISFQEIKKEKILVIEVKESKSKPHRCSSGFYTRSGASSQKLSRDEIWDFMEEEDLLKFDTVTCNKFNFKKDFDKNKLFTFMDRAELHYSKKNYIQILENLNVAKRQGSKIIMNNTGALFFSKNLERIFPHAEISCALFKGTDKHHSIIDRKIFNRDIINNIEDSVDFLKKHLRLEYHFPRGQLRRKEVLEIPEDALREALVNAVTHRNYRTREISVTLEIYDDRVEIYNFGGLHKKLKRSEFGKRSVPRNELIAHLMLRANYIEKMGTGIKKMRRLVRRAKLKPIKFTFTGFTTVIFYRNPLPGRSYTESSEFVFQKQLIDRLSGIFNLKIQKVIMLLRILNSIESNKFLRNAFCKENNIPLRTLARSIQILQKNNFISFEGHSKFGKYMVTKKYKNLKKSLK